MGQFLHGQHVEGRGDGPLAAAVVVGVEFQQRLRAAVLDADFDAVVGEVVLRRRPIKKASQFDECHRRFTGHPNQLSINLVLGRARVELHLSGALHGGEEAAETLVDPADEVQQWRQESLTQLVADIQRNHPVSRAFHTIDRIQNTTVANRELPTSDSLHLLLQIGRRVLDAFDFLRQLVDAPLPPHVVVHDLRKSTYHRLSSCSSFNEIHHRSPE